MGALGFLLIAVGAIIMIVGAVMFLIEAFKEHILWGIGCLLFSPVQLVFLIMHWNVAKKPFFIELAGLPFFIIGMLISASVSGG